MRYGQEVLIAMVMDNAKIFDKSKPTRIVYLYRQLWDSSGKAGFIIKMQLDEW